MRLQVRVTTDYDVCPRFLSLPQRLLLSSVCIGFEMNRRKQYASFSSSFLNTKIMVWTCHLHVHACMLSYFSHVWLFATLSTIACQAPRPWGFSRQEYWSGLPCLPPGNLPNPGIEPGSPTLQADSLPTELPGKSKNTGVGSLSLLQGIVPTQESNWGLLHCRRILYQLSYQGSPITNLQ